MKRGALAGIALSVLTAWGVSAAAAPGHSYGFGSRATALGGAVAADASDGSATFYNPSGLASAPGSELLLGYQATSFALSTNGSDAGIPGLYTLEGSLVGRGELLELPVGFGLALAATNGHLSRLTSMRADEPRWVLFETVPQLVDIALGLALKPLPRLSLGAAVGFLAASRGGFEVSGSAVLADDASAEYDSQLRHAVDAELLSVRYPILGIALEGERKAGTAHGRWRAALTYRGEAKLEQELRGRFTGEVDASFFTVPVSYTFESRSLLAFQPQELTLGATVLLGETRLNADLALQDWSRYPEPVARSGAQLEARLPPGLPLALPPDTQLSAPRSAGFHDRLVLRLGGEQSWALGAQAALVLRAGYSFLPSPAPKRPSAGQFLDADQHVFSLGWGTVVERKSRFLPGVLRLDAHALWAHFASRDFEAQGSAGSAALRASGNAWAAGASLRLNFPRP